MGKYGNGIIVSDGNGNEVIEMGGNWYEKSVPAHLYSRQAPATDTVGDNLAALDSALYIVIGHLRDRSSDKHKQHARVRIKCKRLPSY